NEGCCTLKTSLEPRSEQQLLPWIAQHISTQPSAHFGFYSAPYYGTSASDPARMLDTAAGIQWLTDWLGANRSFGATAYYLDVLARDYYGDPAAILNYFEDGTIPLESVTEGVVDIYPRAGLVSGALQGGAWDGGPGKSPET